MKAVGKPSLRSDGFLLIALNQLEALRANPNSYLHVVENVRQGDPSEFPAAGLRWRSLQRLLTRVREHRTYEIPVPVAEYDAAPTSL